MVSPLYSVVILNLKRNLRVTAELIPTKYSHTNRLVTAASYFYTSLFINPVRKNNGRSKKNISNYIHVR